MHATNLITETSSRLRLDRMAVLAALVSLVVGYSQLSLAQKSGPTTFSSPGQASNALFQAVQNSDEETLESILGAGKEVTSSSDGIEDKLERERFSEKYQQMHRLVQEPDGRTVLYIGAENWPFPIPLVSKNGAWHFDSDSGKQEILFRTVGENETTAIQVCHVLAKAPQTKESNETGTSAADPVIQYAQSLASGGPANGDNTARDTGKQSSPFHGYYFRIVTQSSAAAASAGGRKTGGLTLVSYPARYQSSGVMTFVVTQRGLVYEKDLGPGTATVAPQLKARTGSKWHPAA